MKLSQVSAWRIPSGSTQRVRHNGNAFWEKGAIRFRYVSFGDSIAVGHRINDNWEKDYGWNAQYGVDGRQETTIVPGCYTDLIHRDLIVRTGAKVNTTSFARSGDKVADLMDKLNQPIVRTTLSNADYVTVCIGANDVLHYALVGLPEYINTGDLSTIDAQVDASLAVLDDDNASTSFVALFNKLMSINSKATYVFTTVYNPYKYLWLDGSKDGFFKPMLDTIPQMTILGFEIDELIKDSLLNTSEVSNLVTRVNGICAKAENYVTRLNAILRKKITTFQASNPNVLLADTKAVFDPVPDRPVTAPYHYNDLVNVEYTRGFNTADIRWYPLWVDKYGEDYQRFWWDLASKYITLEQGFHIMGFARELIPMIVEKILEPNVDPHPEEYGHHAMFRSFSEAFGWSALPRRTITFNANGGTGVMAAQTVVALDGNKAYTNINALGFSHGTEGYRFIGWNTKADGSGTAYTDGQFVGLDGDLTLYAQWSNIYTVTFRHSFKSDGTHDSSGTGDMNYYALWIDSVEQEDLGQFSNPARTYRLPYGTPLGVIAAVERGKARSYITWNGTKIAGEAMRCTHDFLLTSDTDIHFEWRFFWDDIPLISPEQSFWNCYITTH